MVSLQRNVCHTANLLFIEIVMIYNYLQWTAEDLASRGDELTV